MESLCFSPPDNLTPFSPITVSYLCGSFCINSSANEFLEAKKISSSDASSLAYKMLFLIVSSNKVVSCLTSEISFLSELILKLFID